MRQASRYIKPGKSGCLGYAGNMFPLLISSAWFGLGQHKFRGIRNYDRQVFRLCLHITWEGSFVAYNALLVDMMETLDEIVF